MNQRPTREQLQELYFGQRTSAASIGLLYGVTGRSIVNWMREAGLKCGGNKFFQRGGVRFEKGRKPSDEALKKSADLRRGKPAHNFGVGRVRFLCAACGKSVFDKPYRRRVVCSKVCRDMYNTMSRGETHWNFKGSNAGFRQRRRLWAEYRDWRTAVLNRDGKRCRVCLVTRPLCAHHLFTWNDRPDKRLDVSNGITMCRSCHWTFHMAKGLHHTTPEMFHDWLSTHQLKQPASNSPS